jgi:phosphatidylserine/phosphatidylglycerophosphate/cardiolipin synthase-like enzyme
MRELLWELNENLATKLIKVRDLVDDINSLRFKLDQKLEKVARAAGVVDALAEPL